MDTYFATNALNYGVMHSIKCIHMHATLDAHVAIIKLQHMQEHHLKKYKLTFTQKLIFLIYYALHIYHTTLFNQRIYTSCPLNQPALCARLTLG